MRNKETLVTISRRTGFAISTVSRVLSGQAKRYRISDKTAELVLGEAKRCNYVPSLLARGLRSNRTSMLGLLIPALSNPYFADISCAVIREAREYGQTVIVVDTMENEQVEQTGITALVSRKVDGVIVVPCGKSPAFLEEIDGMVPVVLIDRYFEDTKLPYVTTDNYAGGKAATELLISHGHCEIVCIQGVAHSMPNRRRVAGYHEALRTHGLEAHDEVVGNDFSVANGYAETKLVLSRPNRPTAIFALSNTIVLGVIKAVRESGLRIPEDVSVVSFDNNPYLDYFAPAVSRISQPLDEMGRIAVKILLQQIESEQPALAQIELSPGVLARESVSTLLHQ